MMATMFRRSKDDGSIAMVVIVSMITASLVFSLLLVTDAGLKSSRRAGDSANAVQIADAGVNDAVKALSANTASFFGSSSLGGAGSYNYTATLDNFVWHIDSTGTDPTGVRRHIVADATDTPVYGNAFFAFANAQLKGTADSYTSPTDTCTTTTPYGIVGSNDKITFTGGTGTKNCRGQFGWPYAADGCVFYGQTTIPNDANGNDPRGAGACPTDPLYTLTQPDPFFIPPVTVPAGLVDEGDYLCSAPGFIPTGVHLYKNVTLTHGCRVPSGLTTTIYATGSVQLGNDTGNCKSVINPPLWPINAPTDCSNFPSTFYKSGWAASLEIKVAGNGTVAFPNHGIFWGVVTAPQSLLTAAGGGTPQVDIFGAVNANSASSAAQFHFHYDTNLASFRRTGRYRVVNWREEPLS